jgi:hypothetical protein
MDFLTVVAHRNRKYEMKHHIKILGSLIGILRRIIQGSEKDSVSINLEKFEEKFAKAALAE